MADLSVLISAIKDRPAMSVWALPIGILIGARILMPTPQQSSAASGSTGDRSPLELVLPTEESLDTQQLGVRDVLEAGGFGGHGLSPMVSLDRAPVLPKAAEATDDGSSFRLSGILSSDQPIAVINGKAVQLNGMIEGWRVERIEPETYAVVLRGPQGQRVELIWTPKSGAR